MFVKLFAQNLLNRIKMMKVFVSHKVLCKMYTTSNQYRFYEAGGAPQWTDTACALLSHLTYRDRRRGPRSTRPPGKRGLHPTPSLTAPTYIRYSLRSYEIGRLRGQLNPPQFGSVHSGRRLPIGGGKRNPFRHYYLQGVRIATFK